MSIDFNSRAYKVAYMAIGDNGYIPPNFLTPHIREYGNITDHMTSTPYYCYELSTGEGIERGTILWGVTVFSMVEEEGKKLHTYNREHKLSKCFYSEEGARIYIGYLSSVTKEELARLANEEG